jgi:hypothetical protein
MAAAVGAHTREVLGAVGLAPDVVERLVAQGGRADGVLTLSM